MPLWAQSGRKKPVFEPDPEAEAAAVEERRGDQRDPIGQAIRQLAGWPSNRSRRAAEMLVVQKEKSLEPIVGVLISQRATDARLKPGGAYVLGRIGDKTHARTLILVAAEKDQHKYARIYLDAAYELDAELAVREAFRFFRLRTTTLRHQAVRFVREHIQRDNLDQVFELLDRQETDLAVAREIGVQMVDRLLQTKGVEWSEVSAAIYRTLGDPSPRVARRAMQLCASRTEQGNLDALNALITRELSYWRERSYAAIALSLHSSAYRTQPFTPESLKELQSARGLAHPRELLAQASAALALAQVALRTSDPDLVKLLDREIPIVLIEAVGAGNRHYRDFSSVMPLAYTMLRRITGKNMPDQAPAWAAWWQDHGDNFRARRELINVEEDDFLGTVIDVRPPGGGSKNGIRIAPVASMRPTYKWGQALAVEERDIADAVKLLKEVGFFDTPESDAGKVADDEALVVVRVGDLVRTVAFGNQSTAGRAAMGHMMKLGTRYRWQHFWDRDAYPSWPLFFGEMNRWFSAESDETKRADKLRELIAASLDDMIYVEDRERAVLTMKDLPGGAKAMTPEQIDALIKAVASEPATTEFVIEAVQFLVPAAGPDVSMKVINVIALGVGPQAQQLLYHVCKSLRPEQIVVLSENKNFRLRIAATRALEDVPERMSNDPLRARLGDESVLVRVAAAEALARRKDTKALPALASLAQDSTRKSVRAAAAYAYGLIGGVEGLRGIEPLLFDDAEPEVRRRAVEGLRAGKGPGSAELLLRVFENETDRTVRAAAAFAVVELETPELVDTLVQRLELTDVGSNARVALVNVLARFNDPRTTPVLKRVLRGDDVNSRDAAALGLARRWEAVGVRQLIRMVQARRHPRAAVQHLEVLTSQGFESEDYDTIARNYEDWFKTQSTATPASWFRDALKLRGYQTKVLDAFVKASKESPDASKNPPPPPPPVPGAADEAVPLLLRVMRDDDWYLARNASAIVAQRMGKGAPMTLEYFLSTQDRERSIRIFNDWWDEEEKRIEAERRG
ncbi:MAG: HEAT repeat domain-containing protein [Planctomycetota bacterium]